MACSEFELTVKNSEDEIVENPVIDYAERPHLPDSPPESSCEALDATQESLTERCFVLERITARLCGAEEEAVTLRLALAEIEVARGRFPDDERLAELRAETEQKLTASGGALTESRRGVVVCWASAICGALLFAALLASAAL